ncbi:MAG: glutathione S-transferase family protein [Rhizobiales bacterium]|jgi:glutathione S-transferase|nr:glutathione S-transferase family protein [Hyphomicrobiales bacterium]
MKIFYAETINPRKVCAVARYLDLPVDFVPVDLSKGEHRTPEYLAINPNGKVPALEDGDVRLWEANAIMCHLARAAKSDLWPDGAQQEDVLRWLSWNSEHFSRHAGTLYFNYIIKPALGLGAPDDAAVKEATGFVRRFGAVLNDHLRGRKYLLGDTLTIADFATAITLPYAARAKIPVDEFPEIVRWHARLNELPAWREPFPKQQTQAA